MMVRWFGLWLLAAAAVASAAAGEEPRLNVYNWSDYIAPDTIPKFEAETGIRVTYDVYDGNEVLEAKLLSGRSGYDVVVPSASPFMARQIAAGVYRVLDKSKLPGWRNLDPHILELFSAADPDNAHGAPYLWSDTGIGYNERQVRAALGETSPVAGLGLIFDPTLSEKLAPCGISLLDTPQEVFPAALAYLRLDPKSRPRRPRQGLCRPRKNPPLHPQIPLLAIHQRPRRRRSVRRARLFGRCDPSPQPGARGRQQGRDRLPRAEGGGDDVGRYAGDPGRRAASGKRAALYRLPAAARGHRRCHQRRLVSEPEPAGDGIGQAGDPQRPGGLPAGGNPSPALRRSPGAACLRARPHPRLDPPQIRPLSLRCNEA